MKNALTRRHRGDGGAAAIEFALVLPVLILLLFGIITFSLVFNRQQGLHAAAREAARMGSLPTITKSEIISRVGNSSSGALQGVPMNGSPSVSVTPNVSQPCRNRPGQTVLVQVTANTEVNIPIWGNQTITLTGRGTFRCEV
jgi:Flp pilus assembly protein TadG